MTRARHYAGARARSQTQREWLSWLDLSKYDPLMKWTATDWGAHLLDRSAVWDLAVRGEPVPPAYTLDLKSDPLASSKVFRAPNAAPIADFAWTDLKSLTGLYGQPPLSKAVGAWETEGKSVAGRIEQLRSSRRRGPTFHPEMLRVAEGLAERNRAGLEQFLASTPFLTAFLRVDLTDSDAALKAAFETWLRERRHAMQALAPRLSTRARLLTNVRGTRTELARWRRLRAVPFMDIMIVAKIEGRRLPTAQVIGERLFSRDADPGRRVREEVRPLALQLLHPSAGRRLLGASADPRKKSRHS